MATRDIQVLTLTAATANANGSDFESRDCKGAHFFINVSAVSGTNPTTTITVEGKDVASGTYYTILASAALAGVTTGTLKVYPGMTAAANLVASDVLPATFRVRFTVGGSATPTITATVGCSLIP
jgi:hypothetical protein